MDNPSSSSRRSFGFFASGERFATRMKKIQGGGETASKTTTAKLELDDEGELLSRCNEDGGLKKALSRFRAERRWGIAERCGGLEW
ncbi:unnamed protein product [Brassica oleracea var. botrytis]